MNTQHIDHGDSNSTDLVIDCSTCVMRRTTACTDCMVTFLLESSDARTNECSTTFVRHAANRHPSFAASAAVISSGSEPAMVFDLAEQRAMRVLSTAGLLPQLRYQAGN